MFKGCLHYDIMQKALNDTKKSAEIAKTQHVTIMLPL